MTSIVRGDPSGDICYSRIAANRLYFMSALIVVFNHSEILLKLFRTNLETRGYRVITQVGDRGSLAMVLELMPDLIILGYLDGYIDDELHLVHALNANVATYKIPMLLCSTGEFAERDALVVKMLPQVYVLRKPFSSIALVMTVKAILDV